MDAKVVRVNGSRYLLLPKVNLNIELKANFSQKTLKAKGSKLCPS